MIGCPICGNEVISKPIKAWKFGSKNVERYECDNCNNKFNLYIGKNKNYTIPKPK